MVSHQTYAALWKKIITLWWFRHTIVCMLYVVLTLLVLFPIVHHPFSTVYDNFDGICSAWIAGWAAHAFTTNPTHLYHAPIFAPYAFSYTFSDPMLTAGIIGLPWYVFTHEPLVFSTINIVFALFGMSIGTYLLVHLYTKDVCSSFVAGVIASLSFTYLQYLGHLHTLMIQWIPLGVYAGAKYGETAQRRWVIVCAACFLAQVLNGPFTGYLFVFAMLLVLCDQHVAKQVWKDRAFLAVTGATILIICAIFYLPFLRASSLFHLERSIRDAAHFSLSIDDFFTKRITSVLFLFVAALMPIFAFFYTGKHRSMFITTWIIFLVGIVMSLGPVLKFNGNTMKIPFPIPLPYAVAYYLLPGFHAFRAPARWLMLSHIMLAVWIGLFLHIAKTKVKVIGVCVIGVVLLCESQFLLRPKSFPSRIKYPSVYRWLRTQPSGMVLHYPPYIYTQGEIVKQEPWRMMISLGDDEHPLFNGYSGAAPKERVNEIVYLINEFPSEMTMNILHKNGIKYVVVHLEEIDAKKLEQLQSRNWKTIYQDLYTIVFVF